jgi:very-short-patch-repair endonuclease
MPESYNDNLHEGAIGKLYQYGRELRQDSTKAEKLLWAELRNRKLNGLKFRRQHALDKFIVDFYCNERKLVVELDGGVHDEKINKEYDEARTAMLAGLNIIVLRFKNEEVLHDIEKVLATIDDTISSIQKTVKEKGGALNNSPSGDGGKKYVFKKLHKRSFWCCRLIA